MDQPQNNQAHVLIKIRKRRVLNTKNIKSYI
jgi:hypothetical protein